MILFVLGSLYVIYFFCELFLYSHQFWIWFVRVLFLEVRWYGVWDLPVLLMQELIAIHFPVNTAFVVFHLFWYIVFHFYSFQCNFKLPSWFVSWPIDYSELNWLIFIYSWSFLFFLLLISILMHCGQKRILDMIYLLWNGLRLGLLPTLWPILEVLLCTIKKNVFSIAVEWKV